MQRCEICNQDARPLKGGCTNRCCSACHDRYCTPGGAISPGHGCIKPKLGRSYKTKTHAARVYVRNHGVSHGGSWFSLSGMSFGKVQGLAAVANLLIRHGKLIVFCEHEGIKLSRRCSKCKAFLVGAKCEHLDAYHKQEEDKKRREADAENARRKYEDKKRERLRAWADRTLWEISNKEQLPHEQRIDHLLERAEKYFDLRQDL